ncbi:MAG: mechanosensitive ion channel domain-containing protein [Planctomycetota bacterium]
MRRRTLPVVLSLLIVAPVLGQEAPPAQGAQAPPPTPEEALDRLGEDPEALGAALKEAQEDARAAIEAARKAAADAEAPDTPSWKKETTHLAVALAEEELALLEERVSVVRGELARRAAERDASAWEERLKTARKDLDAYLDALRGRKPDAKEAEAAEGDAALAAKAEATAKGALDETDAVLAALPEATERAKAELAKRQADHATLRDAAVSEEEREGRDARLPLLERAVALAQERTAFLERRAGMLSKEEETRALIHENAQAVVALAVEKRDALNSVLHGAAAAGAEARQDTREQEEAARKAALAEEDSANAQLRKLTEAIEARLAMWKRDHAEFLSTVAAPQEAELERETETGTTALAEAEQSERLKALDEELGKLDLRVGSLEEELTKLRPERDESLAKAEASVQALKDRIEDTKASWEKVSKEPKLDPVRAQQWQEGMVRLGEIEKERLELLDRLTNAYVALLAEVEAFKKNVAEHRRAVSEWRLTLAEALARGRTTVFGYSAPVSPWLGIPVVVLLVCGLGFLLHLGFRRLIQRRAVAAESPSAKMLLRLLSQYSAPLVLLGMAWVLLNGLPLPEKLQARSNTGAFVVVVGLVTYFLMRGTILLLQRRAAGGDLQGPARTVVRIVFATLGILIILDALDVSITPILTGLGVGSVAVALALQDTLSNFFAGIYVSADKPIRVGDYVKLDTGDEGYVVEVSWRSTRLRTLGNNIVIVPNHKLGQCVITNFHLPEKVLRVPIPIMVSAEEDPARVEAVLIDEMGKAAEEVESMVADRPAQVRLGSASGPSLIEFTVLCWVREFADQYAVTHQLRKRILDRFHREEICAPGARAPAHSR